MSEFFYNISSDSKLVPFLFPNFINIFPIKLSKKDLDFLFENHKNICNRFINIAFQKKWNKEKLVFYKQEIIMAKDQEEDLEEINEDLLNDEAFAYFNLKKEKSYISDRRILYGLYDAIENLGVITGSSKFPINNITIFNSIEFKKVELISLGFEFQTRLFEHYQNNDIVLITGGTGIGKTSQIPKLLFYFETLFSKRKNSLLSLPRVQLVKTISTNVEDSMNLEKDKYVNRYYFGAEIDYKRENSRLIVATNKITVKRFITKDNKYKINSIVLDEVHEPDQHLYIAITIFKNFRENFGPIFFMTATPGSLLKNLKEYFIDIKYLELPNIQLYKIKEYDLFDKEKSKLENIKLAIKKYQPKKKEAGVIFFFSVTDLKKYTDDLRSTFPKIIFYEIYSKSETLATDLEEIETLDTPIILLSTNLLENSITIKKLKIVYDLGEAYIKKFFGGEKDNISMESMIQRRGRVGRVSPGIYIKLYESLKDYEFLKDCFLFPIIIYCEYYNIKTDSIFYIFNKEEYLKRFKKEYAYFQTFEKKYTIEKIFHEYNNNLVTTIESLNIYFSTDIEILNLYKQLEMGEIKPRKIQHSKVYIICKLLNMKLKKVNNGFLFKSPVYKELEAYNFQSINKESKNPYYFINGFVFYLR